eukprot:7732117-Pyramimonas_sp.AAC.1
MPIQWPRRSWSDIRAWGPRCFVAGLRGVEAAQRRIACCHAWCVRKRLPSGVGGWTSGVQ